MKILTVVGARPQFVKASAISRAAIQDGIQEILVHTGQHFDDEMSHVFFEQLSLKEPDHHLDVSGGGHGQMTGRMLERLEPLIDGESPDAVLVYGDTNSTLAGALAAAKLHVPIVHVEAGLRSYRRSMPEEINRVLTDHVSTLLCCPTQTAVENLRREGFTNILNCGRPIEGSESLEGTGPWVANCGDVMVDVLLHYRSIAGRSSSILEQLKIAARSFAVLTIHRAENTASAADVRRLVAAVASIAAQIPVVFPMHPRTERVLRDSGEYQGVCATPGLLCIAPLPYLDFIHLQANARLILTDSGGIQKEAYCLGVRCLTLRDETEWPETTVNGWNRVVGSAPDTLEWALDAPAGGHDPTVFGDGDAALRTMRLIRTAFAPR